MWLFLAFLAVPLVEIALFIQVGGAIGLWSTLAIVIITAVLGAIMVRSQGAATLENLKRSLNEVRDPSEPLVHGAMILFAGALLLTPGFFTDAVGFALLVPAVRAAVFRHLRKNVQMQSFSGHSRQATRDDVIDGDFEDVTQGKSKPTGPSGWTDH